MTDTEVRSLTFATDYNTPDDSPWKSPEVKAALKALSEKRATGWKPEGRSDWGDPTSRDLFGKPIDNPPAPPVAKPAVPSVFDSDDQQALFADPEPNPAFDLWQFLPRDHPVDYFVLHQAYLDAANALYGALFAATVRGMGEQQANFFDRMLMAHYDKVVAGKEKAPVGTLEANTESPLARRNGHSPTTTEATGMTVNTRGSVAAASEFHPAGARRVEPKLRDFDLVEVCAESIISVGINWNASLHHDGHELFRRAGGKTLKFDSMEYEITEALPRLPLTKNDSVTVNWIVRYRKVYGGQLRIVSICDLGTFDPARDNDYQEDTVGEPTVADPTSDKLDEVFPRDENNQPVEDKPEKPTYKGHTAVPDEAIYAIPNHIKRELEIDQSRVGAAIRAAFGMSVIEYVQKHGVERAWDVVEEYVVERNFGKAKTEPTTPAAASNAQSDPTPPIEPQPAQALPQSTPGNGSDAAAVDKPQPGKVDVITGEIVVYDAQRAIERMMQRSDIMTGIHNAKLLKPGIDYGVIPGTDDKKTLLKPGAEKLCSAFGLCPEFHLVDKVVKWDPESPMFYFQYECRLVDIATGKVVATGIGSCNSMESKYRWRKAERTCPECGKKAIIKGKQEYGGGYICFEKKGGCKAKFKDDDKRIVEQPIGQVPNDDPFSLVNTLDKMAQKRSLIAATLIGANASAFYTQDIESLPDFGYIDIEAA